jgi:hypothetical protein
MVIPGARITAAATTGPANAPTPTSSTPAIAVTPLPHSSRSKAKLGRNAHVVRPARNRRQKRIPCSPSPIALGPNRTRIDAIMTSMISCGGRAADAGRCGGRQFSSFGF